MPRTERAWTGMLLCALLTAVGCGDSKDKDNSGGGASASKPVYLMAVRIFAEDSILTYAKVAHELDLNLTVDDLKDAREFPEFASFRIHDGHVYVGDSEQPLLTKFKITDDLKWEQVGTPLNFGNYVTEGGLNINATRGDDVYLYYGTDNTARVHYNLADFKILGTHDDTKLPEAKDNWVLINLGIRNRTAFSTFPGAVVWPFGFHEEEATGIVPKYESYLAVYDPKTHAEKDVLKTGCLNLELMSSDEDGNVYFSTMFNPPVHALYGLSKPNCVVRVKKDGTLDSKFGEKNLADFSGGEDHGANFVYLGKGKAIASYLDTAKLVETTKADFKGPFDNKVLCHTRWDCDEELADLYDGTLWYQRVIDLEKGTSKKVTGYEPGHEPNNFYVSYFTVEGRAFVYAVGEEGNAIWYELDTDTGKVSLTGQSTESGLADEAEIITVARVR